MVRGFVEMMLGEVGRQILYFYEANAWVINSIVLAYGLTMYMSWINLVRIYRHLVVQVAKNTHLDEEHNQKSSVKRIQKNIGIPWEEAIASSPFPLVSRITALVPRRKTVAVLQELLDEKEIISDARDVLKGANVRKLMPNYRTMVKKEIQQIKEKTSSQK